MAYESRGFPSFREVPGSAIPKRYPESFASRVLFVFSRGMERASHASKQRIVTLALAVLDRAACASRTHRVDTLDVHLALAALWCILRDRESLLAYYERAQAPARHPWETCREPYHGIACSLRQEGWDAPADAATTWREPQG